MFGKLLVLSFLGVSIFGLSKAKSVENPSFGLLLERLGLLTGSQRIESINSPLSSILNSLDGSVSGCKDKATYTWPLNKKSNSVFIVDFSLDISLDIGQNINSIYSSEEYELLYLFEQDTNMSESYLIVTDNLNKTPNLSVCQLIKKPNGKPIEVIKDYQFDSFLNKTGLLKNVLKEVIFSENKKTSEIPSEVSKIFSQKCAELTRYSWSNITTEPQIFYSKLLFLSDFEGFFSGLIVNHDKYVYTDILTQQVNSSLKRKIYTIVFDKKANFPVAYVCSVTAKG